MNRFNTKGALRLLIFSGRLALTCALACGFLLILAFTSKIQGSFLGGRSDTQRPPIYVGNPPPPSQSAKAVPFWPEFPHNAAGNAHASILNGIQILTESWETHASASQVLYYYREQMAARGWLDVTEETYGLRPKVGDLERIEANASDPAYLAKYRSVMDANLALSRGDWSLHVGVEPANSGPGTIAVRIYAAKTPLLQDFFKDLTASIAAAPGDGNEKRQLEALQISAGQQFHTTISTKNALAPDAFQQAIKELSAQGWRPVIFLPPRQESAGHFAWLIRSNQYAALSVKALPTSRGSAVTLTAVSPDSSKSSK